MDEIFERILADMKKLMLDEGIQEDMGAVLSDSHDAIALAWEVSMDRRIEAKVGKTAYQAILVQEGIVPDVQTMLQTALGGRSPKEDLPN